MISFVVRYGVIVAVGFSGGYYMMNKVHSFNVGLKEPQVDAIKLKTN